MTPLQMIFKWWSRVRHVDHGDMTEGRDSFTHPNHYHVHVHRYCGNYTASSRTGESHTHSCQCGVPISSDDHTYSRINGGHGGEVLGEGLDDG